MPDMPAPKTVYLKDYTPPPFLVDHVDLVVDLHPIGTTVTSRLSVRRNPQAATGGTTLALDGQDMELVSLCLDGDEIGSNRYRQHADGLEIDGVPDAFTLDVVTRIDPDRNTALEGLYRSNGTFTTQCEAEGFRKITYFPDRPDVMARFTTTIVADEKSCPVLLGNGNRVDHGAGAPGRHWAKWDDPIPKPSYLFALVAGDLHPVEDRFTTRSGKTVPLRLFVRREDLDRCDHAMDSLKRSMAWDEQTYGFEYDLDEFNIVAVPDFNMGAMENKGLNIFNTALLLARPDTATDADYRRIEGVVAHEYFHNWTGNRITCRDWFQLTLKEGLTVFRDQQFSADMGGPALKRIQDVRRLRASQFPEDGGPLAHPIRPKHYIEINNFYTATVYEKGAEVIRMIHTLIGPEAYRRGIDLYAERHDLQAVTCEDFVQCMQDASGLDLSRFRRWYDIAGTPEVSVSELWDADSGRFTLTFEQTTPTTPGQDDKPPLVIPIALGLLGPDGAELPVRQDGDIAPGTPGTRVVTLTEARESVTFVDLPARPVPSLLRGFSAPVRLRGIDPDRLQFLFLHDTDPFGRWEAGQQLAARALLGIVHSVQGGTAPRLDPGFIDAWQTILRTGVRENGVVEPELTAETLRLPSEDFLAEQMPVVDVEAVHRARTAAKGQLATALRAPLLETFHAHDDTDGAIDRRAMGRRALKLLALDTLGALHEDAEIAGLLMTVFRRGPTMTETLGALSVLNGMERPERQQALDAFYDRWRGDALVVDKWFTLQASCPLPGTVQAARALLEHPDFTWTTPNRVRSVVGAFAYANPRNFHATDGSGYRFLADCVLQADRINPQLSARLLTPLGRWRRQDSERQAKMRTQLERILGTEGLSRDVYEIASKSAG